MTVVVETGPVAVCGPAGGESEKVCAAVEFVDEETALVGDEPMTTADLWGEVIIAVTAGPVDRLVVLHPTWWPRHRVDRVCAAAGQAAAEVIAVTRTAALRVAVAGTDPTVVEIGPEVVVVADADDRIVAIPRDGDPRRVGAAVADAVGATAVAVVDAPTDVVGATELAAISAEFLRSNAVAVVPVGAGALRRAAAGLCPPVAVEDPPPRAGGRRGVAAVAGAALSTVAAGVAVTWPSASVVPPDEPVTLLVEGRVGVTVPATWRVDRITDGPGSARVQVSTPADPRTALLLIQSPVPTSYTQSQAADTLRAALAEQDAGIFVDVVADDRRNGRPVVTYREVRPGRHVDWSVFVDGAVRIAVGCQYPPDRGDSIRRACGQAVQSAHAIF